MSRRGSAQLLLLFLRSRARLGWTLGAMVSVLVVAGLVQAGDDFPILDQDGDRANDPAKRLASCARGHARAGRLAMVRHTGREPTLRCRDLA